jgi:hypothetical protein
VREQQAPAAGAARQIGVTVCCEATCHALASEPVLVGVAGTVRPVLMCRRHAEAYLSLVRN